MRKPYWLVFLCACCTDGKAAEPAARPLPEKFLSWPFSPGENWRITNSYNGPNGHGSGIPYALDFQRVEGRTATEQSSVRAAAPGKVVAAVTTDRGGYGKYVVLDHGNGFATLYGHLTEVSARPGMEVPALEKLGIAGNTGNSTGAHLHFEVRDIQGVQRWQDGTFVKPEPIMGQRNFAGATPGRPLPRTPEGKPGSYSYTLKDLDPSVQNVAADVAEQLKKLFGTEQPRRAPRIDVGNRTPPAPQPTPPRVVGAIYGGERGRFSAMRPSGWQGTRADQGSNDVIFEKFKAGSVRTSDDAFITVTAERADVLDLKRFVPETHTVVEVGKDKIKGVSWRESSTTFNGFTSHQEHVWVVVGKTAYHTSASYSGRYETQDRAALREVIRSLDFLAVPAGEVAGLPRLPEAGPRRDETVVRDPGLTDAETYAQARAFTRRWEGGFVDHPNDPGGRTNKGITQGTYDRYRRDNGQPTRNVRDIADAEVEAIYYERYWKASGADALPLPLAVAHFDTAVNFGVGRAKQWLPEARRHADPTEAAKAYVQLRIAFRHQRVQQNPTQRVFLRGWLNRDNALLEHINSRQGAAR